MPTIQELRVQQDIGQRQLAKLAGIGVTSLVNLEKGRPVQASTVKKVCQALGVQPDAVTGVNIFSAVQAAARRQRSKIN